MQIREVFVTRVGLVIICCISKIDIVFSSLFCFVSRSICFKGAFFFIRLLGFAMFTATLNLVTCVRLP